MVYHFSCRLVEDKKKIHRGSVVHKLAVTEAQIHPARAVNCSTMTQSASVQQRLHAADSYPAYVDHGLDDFAEACARQRAFASACAVHIHPQATFT